MNEEKSLTKIQIYRREYNKRPEVIEKKKLSNTTIIKLCGCGGSYSMCHRKQHEKTKIHIDWSSSGKKAVYNMPDPPLEGHTYKFI